MHVVFSTAAVRAKRDTRALQRALTHGAVGAWINQLHYFVSLERWRYLRSSRGTPYEDFGEYVCDDARYGLGLRDEKAARLLKTALFMHGHVLAWLGVLRRIVRPKGRPPKTPTPGELFVPFYKLSASASATDRIILALADANRFDLLEEIGAKRLKAKAAGGAAGILNVDHSRGPACDIARLQTMSNSAKVKWALRVFHTIGIDAQCDFLERVLGSHGEDVSAQWRRRRQ